jgi:hypothetical protein
VNTIIYVTLLICAAFAGWANWAVTKWFYTRWMGGTFPPTVRVIVIFSSVVAFVIMSVVGWIALY